MSEKDNGGNRPKADVHKVISNCTNTMSLDFFNFVLKSRPEVGDYRFALH